MLSIRVKLLVFIPVLVILLNLISFFIYQTGKTVQESYNLMIERIIMYNQISHETQDNLRSLTQYMIDQNQVSLQSFLQHKDRLTEMSGQLSRLDERQTDYIAMKNFQNMLTSFLRQEDLILKEMRTKNAVPYTDNYRDAEKVAEFIREDSQNLIDVELKYYQSFYWDILRDTAKMNQLGLALFAITTLLSVVFAIWLSQGIIKPIGRLVQTSKQISDGNLYVEDIQLPQRDELGILAETFNQMLRNIRELLTRNLESLEKDKLVKELELKALQSQINPHFLFNTLNVISKLAFIEGAEKTSDLSVSVSNLLRYSLQKLDQPVTLRSEVAHARDYFSILKARFRERVSFITEVDEDILEQPIPCLTLQPILENAFIHGIEGMEAGAVLKLIIKRTDDNILVEISDNGVGMDEATCQSLLSDSTNYFQRAKGHSTGLGTRNVYKRLCLFYNRENVMEIKSRKMEGTTVILRLPFVQGEGNGNVQAVNS